MFSSEPILVHQVQERVRLQPFGHDPSLLIIINILVVLRAIPISVIF